MTRKFALGSRIAAPADFERDLNPEQLAVATAENGPMLVIAGAGTGKTRALTYRLAWLVERGIDPARILLVTFTNRAAREMLARVDTLVRRDPSRLWGGTFHHIANRILREHGERIGISRDFTILDREDTKDLLRSCVCDAGLDLEQRRFPGKAVLAAISSFVHNTMEPLETVLAKRYPMFARDAPRIASVLSLYEKRKRERQLLARFMHEHAIGGQRRPDERCRTDLQVRSRVERPSPATVARMVSAKRIGSADFR